MENNKISFIDKYKERSILYKINDVVVVTAVVAIIVAVIIAYIAIATNFELSDGSTFTISSNKLVDYFLVPLLAVLTLAGILSVVASNNKAPIALLVMSSLATIYKFMYPLVQLAAGQDNINTSPLIGQPILMVTLIIQVYFWIRWNKMTDEGKFVSETLKGKRSYIAYGILSVILILQIIASVLINGITGFGSIWVIFIDVMGSMLYLSAAILMGFGNILCFPLFFLSDMTWLFWTILDLTSSTDPLLIMISLLTLIQVLAYSVLAVTGFTQWFIDDYERVDGKFVKKDRIINE